MRHFIHVAWAGIVVATISTAAAAQTHEFAKGSTVTLTSCVTKGEKDKTYVLTYVADVPVHPATHGKVVYWLDKSTAEKLSAHVGHQIRVVGKVDGVEKREMEVKTDDNGLIVEVEGPGQDVRTTPDKVGVADAVRTSASPDVTTTVVRLKVETLEMVAANCPLAKK